MARAHRGRCNLGRVSRGSGGEPRGAKCLPLSYTRVLLMRVTVKALASESVGHHDSLPSHSPVTPLRGLCSRKLEAPFTQNWGTNVANGRIHNGQMVETTHMFINRQMETQDVDKPSTCWNTTWP